VASASIYDSKILSAYVLTLRHVGRGYMSRAETRLFTARVASMLRGASSPANRPGRAPLAWMHGHGPFRPRGPAGIGEKRCIDSTRLEVVPHQRRLGHRRLAATTRPRKLHTARLPFAQGEGTCHATSEHPTIVQGRSPHRPEKWKKKPIHRAPFHRPPGQQPGLSVDENRGRKPLRRIHLACDLPLVTGGPLRG